MERGRSLFGTLPDGGAVEAIALVGAGSIRARILTYGASLQALEAPDRDGIYADVTLGYATLEDYLARPQYFGATVGRVANRIAGGRFTLDGQTFQVPANNGPNALHGGERGFDKANWQIVDAAQDRVSLRHISADGDQGFPGTLTVEATYSLAEENGLSVEYVATCDRPTIVNLSNHAYWNLAGEGSGESAMDHLLTIPADHYLPADSGLIPTGEFRPVEGTPFDFREPRLISARLRDASDAQIRAGRGYDHHWAVSRRPAATPHRLARLVHPGSGRCMDVLSNQPGLQFYSGNFLDGTSYGKSCRLYRMGDAVALEPQMCPDTPNRPEFGSIRLDPGETYRNLVVWRFSTL
jgi:aldose 1-epimerase